jgi:YHS domain-containing protein
MTDVDTLIRRIDQELAVDVNRQSDGQTYYFVGEDTRREFEQQPAAKR